MQGFARGGDDSEYVNALGCLWQVGEKIPGAAHSFYEYGEADIRGLTRQEIVRQVRLPDFYGRPTPGKTPIRQSNGQPFAAVSAFIHNDLEPAENNLYVITTDLYEQNKENLCFSQFFQQAFTGGLSGALFAVTSQFNGTIYNISPTRQDPHLRVNGRSTFFIIIVGKGNTVADYAAKLAKEFSVSNITDVEKVLFAQERGRGAEDAAMFPISRKRPRRESDFDSPDFAYTSVNLIRAPHSFYTWTLPPSKQKAGKAPVYESAPAEGLSAYRLVTDIGSRWVASLPASLDDKVSLDQFEYRAELSAAFSRGGAPERGAPSEFDSFAAGEVLKARVLPSGDIPEEARPQAPLSALVLSIETKNKELESGFYHITYNIKPSVKVPAWVTERNAADQSALRASNRKGALVKTLSLWKIYTDIADVYHSCVRGIYQGEAYFVR
jgi:hypothetical protein